MITTPKALRYITVDSNSTATLSIQVYNAMYTIHHLKGFVQASLSGSRHGYSVVSIKNIDILPNRQYIANTADSAQEQYS